MLDPEAPDERRDEIAVNARHRIEAGTTLKQERSWGTRKMAYEIRQRNEADYRFFRFEQSDGVLDDLNHNLKITDGVLRFRIYKVDADAPVVDPPPPITLMAGGERPGGRPRRDDRGYDDRPPRGPEPEAAAPAPAVEADASAPTEAPAAEAEPEPADEPTETEPAEEASAGEPAEEAPTDEAEGASADDAEAQPSAS